MDGSALLLWENLTASENWFEKKKLFLFARIPRAIEESDPYRAEELAKEIGWKRCS